MIAMMEGSLGLYSQPSFTVTNTYDQHLKKERSALPQDLRGFSLWLVVSSASFCLAAAQHIMLG